jgi:hypothetical protein
MRGRVHPVWIGVLLGVAACAGTSGEGPLRGRYAYASGMHHFSPCGSPRQYWIVPGQLGGELQARYAELGVEPKEEVLLEGTVVLTPNAPQLWQQGSHSRAHDFHGRVNLRALTSMRLLEGDECL